MSTVLVVGAGGREHALAWKLAQSPRVIRVIVAPGNDGYPRDWERWPAKLGEGRTEFERLAKLARTARVDLAVIGPDNPLADGIVDVFQRAGILTFGPTQGAAQLEASKAFAKDVMQAARIPTAAFQVVHTLEEADEFIEHVSWNTGWVVKADGLALGKGVRVCGTREEARQATRDLIQINNRLVIEERLQGEEISWMAFCDGERAALLEPARDYKRLRDGDQGPNTGGMGAYSPVPGLPEALQWEVREKVFLPVLEEMQKRGIPFRGLLYAGLMYDRAKDRYWVLEFNARFGDPETQVLLPRMADDLFIWCRASAQGALAGMPQLVPFKSQAAVVVVGAAKGYPESPEKNVPIRGLLSSLTRAGLSDGTSPQEATYFVAGVKDDPDQGGELATAGGRVFAAVGMGEGFEEARRSAYERLKRVEFAGMQYRSDIAQGIEK